MSPTAVGAWLTKRFRIILDFGKIKIVRHRTTEWVYLF